MDISSNYSYANAKSVDSPSSSYSNSMAQPEERAAARPPAYRSALHSVRKNVITKKPIAPMPPTPPKVYKVNPVDFRDVVQRLTGAIEFQPTRLQEVAPPPLSLSPPLPHMVKTMVMDSAGGGFNVAADQQAQEEDHQKLRKLFDGNCNGAASPMGFNLSLSPASMAWCSSLLLSPGALSS